MRFLSLFSGIDAASVAWSTLGWEAVAFSEVDPFASAVLAYRYPGVVNLGDIARITEDRISALGPIDIVVFGFPCQDLSVAGRRKGLRDEEGNTTRSGLFYEATRIVRAAAERCRCRWLLAENVPGLLSSNRGRDFAEVIREITGLAVPVPADGWRNGGVAAVNGTGWSAVWRCLDARFFGVPQRRRRVFVVGHPGNDWRAPVEVLFERESLSGNPPSCHEAWEEIAGTIGGGSGRRGWCDDLDRSGVFVPVAFGGNNTRGPIDVATARNVHSGPHGRLDFESETFVVGTLAASGAGTARPAGQCNELDMLVRSRRGVRRLTPLESERLQGLPDNWTLIPWKGRPAADCPDGPRYKAIGNSFAVPVVRWIGERIQLVDEIINLPKGA